MNALIFAAGRGERLKPLTDSIPKPLVTIKGKPLIQYHIDALIASGIKNIVINVSWLKEQIMTFVTEYLSNFPDVKFTFSIEENYPLETGGGMLKALPLLGPNPFIVVNADIFTDFSFENLQSIADNQLMNLIMVENPIQNPNGDFGVKNGYLTLKNDSSYTYSGIGLYNPKCLTPPFNEEIFSIVPFIKAAINARKAMAQVHQGKWHDVGTLERLAELNQL
ncbi:MAG: nucleotidyltransferase family protein [Marinicella sp.]